MKSACNEQKLLYWSGQNVKDADRERACDSIQEIETDLVYRMVEAYQQNRIDLFINSLNMLTNFFAVSEKVCPKE